MITLAILLSLLFITILTIVAGGVGIILACSDLIICGLLIWLLVKLLRRR